MEDPPPPIFCTATDTATELENTSLCCNQSKHPHKLDRRAEVVVIPDERPLHPALDELIREPYLQQQNANSEAYVDVFVDNLFRIVLGSRP